MNKLDVTVINILGKPFKAYGRWWLQAVVDDCYGEPYDTELMFDTEEECLDIEIGAVLPAYPH